MIQARNVSHIGVEGVVVSEGERTFQLATINRQDAINSTGDITSTEDAKNSTDQPRILTVPKPHTVFAFQWADRLITIYGNHFIQRSADRSAKKYAMAQI